MSLYELAAAARENPNAHALSNAQVAGMVHEARRDALEEAARAADKWASDTQREHGNGGPAASIRALGEKP